MKEDIYSTVTKRLDDRQVGKSIQFQFIQSLPAFFFKYKSENKFFQDGFALQKINTLPNRKIQTHVVWILKHHGTQVIHSDSQAILVGMSFTQYT